MNDPSTIGQQAQKDPAQIELEIGRQRQHIEEIVQALESKLSPGEMLDRVLGMGKGSGREFAGNLAEAVKANPVPALITAAGLMWLYTANRSAGTSTVTISESTTTEVPATSGGLSDKLHAAKSTIGEKAHGAAGSIKSGAHSAKESVAGGVHRATEGYGTMLQENPLAAGAIAVAVGALLGALIPPTRKEDELMGDVSDRLIDRVKTTAREQGSELARHAKELTQPGATSTESATQSTAGTDVTGRSLTANEEGSVYGSQRAH